jgi:hypothetical protein
MNDEQMLMDQRDIPATITTLRNIRETNNIDTATANNALDTPSTQQLTELCGYAP